jgi:carboxyl-terminal processing protease
MLAVIDAVQEHHVDPPTRQEMLLQGIKSLLKAADVPAPAGLSDRISHLTTMDQYTALVREMWPKGNRAHPAAADELASALLGGLCQAVSGQPELLDPEFFKVAGQFAGNRYVGTGIQVRNSPSEQYAEIVVAMRGGPAERAGIKAGDLILSVDGQSMHKRSLRDLVQALRGDEGVDVTMEVRQPKAASRTYRLTRGVVPFELVQGFRRVPGGEWTYRPDASAAIAYVHVDSITSSIVHELRQAESRARGEGLRALVLDLRGARFEGIHNSALAADAFLEKGLLWRVRDSHGRVKEYRADPDCLFRGWPLVVLIDGKLGGAEVLAAALRDHHRAILVGEPAPGDGFQNTMIPLPAGQGAIRMRTGILERADPKQHDWNIQPDHRVARTAKQRDAWFDWRRGFDKVEAAASKAGQTPEDPQLAKALEILRAALKNAGQAAKPTPTGGRS